MDIDHLLTADKYPPGHQLRVVRDLILEAAVEATPLAKLLERAWRAGYASKEREDQHAIYRARPHPNAITESEARAIIARRFPDEDRHTVEWEWNADQRGWVAIGADFLIRPGINGIITMEAACEWAGEVITRSGEIVKFDDGTFR